MAIYQNYIFGTVREIRPARNWNNGEGFSQDFIVDNSYTTKEGKYVEQYYCVSVNNGRLQIPLPDGHTKYAVEVRISCREREGQNGTFWNTSLTAVNIETLDSFMSRQPEAQISPKPAVGQPQAPYALPATAPQPVTQPSPQVQAQPFRQQAYTPQTGTQEEKLPF